MQTLKQRKLLKKFVNRLNKIETIAKAKRIPFEDRVAYVGLVFLQGSTIPSHLSGNFPPASLCLLALVGLFCYQYRAYKQNDMVYTVGNTCGIILNGSMLIRIILTG